MPAAQGAGCAAGCVLARQGQASPHLGCTQTVILCLAMTLVNPAYWRLHFSGSCAH